MPCNPKPDTAAAAAAFRPTVDSSPRPSLSLYTIPFILQKNSVSSTLPTYTLTGQGNNKTHHSPVLIARVEYLRQRRDTRNGGREIESGRIHMVQALDVVEVESALVDGHVPDLLPTR